MEESTNDLFTKLQDQILLQILSILSLKEAIKITSLSTSLSTLCSPQNLYFHINSHQTPQFIAHFLHSYDFPEILKFSLKLSDQKSTQSLSLIATKGVEKELHLNFLEEHSNTKGNFNLKLALASTDPSNISPFSSLKILNLRSVTHLSANMVITLFSNFVSLESLKIEKCGGLKRLDVESDSNLKELRVVDCPDLEDLSICAGNLRSFLYKGGIVKIELKDAYQLFDVMLDMRDGLGGNGFDCEEVLLLLQTLKDVEVLTLSAWLLEWLISAGVIFKQIGFRSNKLRELQLIESSINRRMTYSLAFFLDICPSLEFLHINIDGRKKSGACPRFHFCWHEPYFEVDYAILKKNCLQVTSLKVIKMKGLRKEEEELLLLYLLLLKSMLLKSMNVEEYCVGNKINAYEIVKIPLTQLKVTSNRQPKQTTILSPFKDYYFGFVKEPSL